MLKVRERISEKKAKCMVEDFTLFSNHLHTNLTKNLKRKDLPRFYKARELSFHKICTAARTFKNPVPNVENLIGASDITFIADNEDNVLTFEKNGVKKVVLQGSGRFSTCDYQAKFELACKARGRAIELCSIEEIHNSIGLYIASFESFFNDVSKTYNHFKGHPLLIDSKTSPVSLEDKIRNWMPQLSGGKKLDLGGVAWMNFKELLEIRNEVSIHPKNDTVGMTYSEMANVLNKFNTAFGELFFEMHRQLDIEVFSALVRAKYHPEIYVDYEELPTR